MKVVEKYPNTRDHILYALTMNTSLFEFLKPYKPSWIVFLREVQKQYKFITINVQVEDLKEYINACDYILYA